MGIIPNVAFALVTIVLAWLGMDKRSRRSPWVWLAALVAFVGLVGDGVQMGRVTGRLKASRDETERISHRLDEANRKMDALKDNSPCSRPAGMKSNVPRLSQM